MAVEPNEELEVEIEDVEQPEGDEATEVNDEGEDESGAEAGFEIQFGDEAAPASGERETGLVKHLREQLRDRDRRLAEAEKAKPQQQPIVVGERPSLAGCDYDEDRYEQEFAAWKDRKAEADRVNHQSEEAARQANEQWNREYSSYQAKAATMRSRFPDYDEAEGTATAALNQVQQAVIVKVADDPALILNALGRHPGKLAEISKITDPLKLAHALAGLEKGLKVMPKRTPPAPEQIVSGTARVTQGKDKELERLEKEADRTGDRTKIREYRQSRKQAA